MYLKYIHNIKYTQITPLSYFCGPQSILSTPALRFKSSDTYPVQNVQTGQCWRYRSQSKEKLKSHQVP